MSLAVITRAAIKVMGWGEGQGSSLMGAGGAISSGSSRKWSCSCHTGGIKAGPHHANTHSVSSQLSSLQIFLI